MPMKLRLILDESAIGGRRYYLNERADIVDQNGHLVPVHEELNVRRILDLAR